MTKIARMSFSIHGCLPLPLYQLDIKNVLLYSNLKELVNMEQPCDFVTLGESSSLVCRFVCHSTVCNSVLESCLGSSMR